MSLEKDKDFSCILVGGHKVFDGEEASMVSHSLKELSSLSLTLGLKVKGKAILKLRKINPSTFYGKGQLESILNKAAAMNCSYIIFNDEITPSQFKNIQKITLKKKVFDRTGIILDIFKNNAKTKESKLQVELASLQYMLPRLTRQWTHLERQMGGTGTTGGPGEKQIEIDRRLIGKRISKLKTELEKIKKNRKIQSYSRKNVFRVSLVGYTNAGKSSLLNALCKPETAYVENRLFATLDTTTRSVTISKSQNILVTDTVGFIKDLPHNLVASFRSTFEEVESSDLILFILDSSSPRELIEEHLSTVKKTLSEMSISYKNSLLVFNKIDCLERKSEKIKYLKKKYSEAFFISAKNYIMTENLLHSIGEIAQDNLTSKTVKLPHRKSFLLKHIYENFNIESRKDDFEYIDLKLSGDSSGLKKLVELIDKD